jgi:hypothetical protein
LGSVITMLAINGHSSGIDFGETARLTGLGPYS